ncbi:hypothetical protein Csa_010045 [Cucumis sativus]|uniref:Uncharacterized protein n=1 Tax=Cucumis sativus TaxID=3659 RepID=A0A0A0L8X6_CUCSA|nr:hypothetical protein Csa_010045 [Cucumis sativus]
MKTCVGKSGPSSSFSTVEDRKNFKAREVEGGVRCNVIPIWFLLVPYETLPCQYPNKAYEIDCKLGDAKTGQLIGIVKKYWKSLDLLYSKYSLTVKLQ